MSSSHSDEPLARGQHVVAVAALIVRERSDAEARAGERDAVERDETHARRLLAMRRAPDNLAGPGLWETLSGRVEHGEQPLAAIAREIAEECALEVELEPRPFAAYAAQRRGLPMIVIFYRARYLAGEVRLSPEHDAYAWLTASEFRARSSLLPLVTVVEQALTSPL